MITVYAKYFTPTPESGFASGSGDTEQELWSIPNQNGNEKLFLDAKVSSEMGTAGNFEFSVPISNPYYRIWKHLKTIIRVVYDGETIFYGRVLTIDRDMFRTRRIHCEGALTFFMDSVFEGMYKGTNGGNTEGLDLYLEHLLDFHNKCMDDGIVDGSRCPEKKIFAGEMPGHYTAAVEDAQKIPIDVQKRATTKGYKTTKEWLDELVSDYGGNMRVRYNDSDGKLYLDWMKTYFNKDLNDQLLSVSENVVDLSDSVEVDNIFTHVVAVGKNNKYAGSGSSGGGGGTGNKITVTTTGSGTASASVGSATSGTSVTVTATASENWAFSYWTAYKTGDTGMPVSIPATPASVSFTMPSYAVTVVAHFVRKAYDEGEDPDNPQIPA